MAPKGGGDWNRIPLSKALSCQRRRAATLPQLVSNGAKILALGLSSSKEVRWEFQQVRT
jgi:hypothetical protein